MICPKQGCVLILPLPAPRPLLLSLLFHAFFCMRTAAKSKRPLDHGRTYTFDHLPPKKHHDSGKKHCEIRVPDHVGHLPFLNGNDVRGKP